MQITEGAPAPDAELLVQAQAGDEDAFGELYERYAQNIFVFLFAQLENRLDAEDITEDVFLRAWHSLPKYKDRGFAFSAYLYRIARNALIDHHRSTKRAKLVPVEDVTLKAEDVASDPSQSYLTNLEHRELREALSKLPEDYSQVLVLRFINSLEPAEVAKVMKRSNGAVRTLQHRALKSLRSVMEEEKAIESSV